MKHNYKLICAIVAVLLICIVKSPSIFAANTYESKTYIVRLEDVSLYSKSSSAQFEIINENHGLYRVNQNELDYLLNSNNIDYYELDCKVELFDSDYPNDEMFEDQWNVQSTKASFAWNAGITGSGVKIAVIDSGLVKNHPDIDYSNVAEGWNYIADCLDTDDTVGHGSFATGIIACTINNSIGIAGLCDKATIIPLKCFDSAKTTSMSLIVQAIYDAVDKYNCDIINMSLGSSVKSEALKGAVEYAESNNIIVTGAVGNYGTGQTYYPAGFDTVVGVGSIDKHGNVSSFSQKNSSVMVTAPGENITSISNEPNVSEAYTTNSGTSFSAPHVTACAAILKCIDNSITPAKFREIIKTSSDDLGATGYDTNYGYGALNIQKCLEAAVSSHDIFIFPLKNSATDIDGQVNISSTIQINKNIDNGYLSIFCTYDDNQMTNISILNINPQDLPFTTTHTYTAPESCVVKHLFTDTSFKPICMPQTLNCK